MVWLSGLWGFARSSSNDSSRKSISPFLLFFFLSFPQNLSGDCTETVVLLHTLADKYRNLGQAHVAAGLLRRAVLHLADPVSGAHLDATLHARMALAEVLAEGGAIEDALNQYRAIISSKGIPGLLMSVALKDSIRGTKLAAAAAAATLLTKLGREAEAEHVMVIYGAKQGGSKTGGGTSGAAGGLE